MKLFPSTLLIHNSTEELESILSINGHKNIVNNPDIFEITEYTISSVRQIGKFLSQKPIAHQTKIVIIRNAEQLQTASQNALLKNLEEPGPNNHFILTTRRPNSLVSTILSRCHTITFNDSSNANDTIIDFPQSLHEQLRQAESLVSDRLSTISLLENQLTHYQLKLVNSPTRTNQKIIRKISKSISLIKANIDPKTALDYLFLS